MHRHRRSRRQNYGQEKMNSAIIAAAGSGTRFRAEKPKQFLEIAGKPLIFHSLDRFEKCSSIDEIILVLSSDEIENFKNLAAGYNLTKLKKIIRGGKTRAESVLSGLQAVDKKCQIIAVHDGARPLVSSEEISRTIEMAKKTGAACLTAKVTDTIKKIADDKIVGTIDREILRRALTPQCFQIEILRRAFAGADLSEAVTDECFLVERLGYEIAFVDGSAKNIKITTREDFALAEILLKQFD
jgi:2-C-methyl-D-erythritol 4-phosphate cytidylyltransferase